MSSKDKIGNLAVITGGGRGIGRAITLRLIEDGWHCVIVGLEIEDLEKTRSCVSVSDLVTPLECDIATGDGRQSLAQLVEKREPQLGLLVNCAATSTPMPLLGQTEHMWSAELQTNLVAVAMLSTWAIFQMKDIGGSVINIGSIYGSLGMNPNFYDERQYPQDGAAGPTRVLPYHASKAGVASVTRDLAIVAGQWNVRVNTISPGMIKTPERPIRSDLEQRFCMSTPLRRLGSPDEIASVVSFLASSEASFVTGAEWIVDGGWSIW